jgi:hypothetical protein
VCAGCAGLAALLRGTPARKRLFQMSPDGGRVCTKPGAVGIIRIKRAALDYLIKPLQNDVPVSSSCRAIHTCYPTPAGATQCWHCSIVVWANYDHIHCQPYAMLPIYDTW